jgi:predicted DNA-binding protein
MGISKIGNRSKSCLIFGVDETIGYLKKTELTVSKLEFVGTKIPSEWVQKLKQLTKKTGKTQSAIVRDAIAAAIGVNQETEVNSLREELGDLKTRVQALEQLTRLSKVNQTKPIATKTKPTSPPLDGAMRTGELFLALQQKGYTRSSSSLLKALNKAIASGVVPDELARFGVICDFELKKLSNPLSGKVRWLFLD